MTHTKEVRFSVEIEDLKESNIAEKLLPYMRELEQSLINNKCKDVRINTIIKIYSSHVVRVEVSVNENK